MVQHWEAISSPRQDLLSHSSLTTSGGSSRSRSTAPAPAIKRIASSSVRRSAGSPGEQGVCRKCAAATS
eukprot:3628710-Prorocentrum_lima.AAC.1